MKGLCTISSTIHEKQSERVERLTEPEFMPLQIEKMKAVSDKLDQANEYAVAGENSIELRLGEAQGVTTINCFRYQASSAVESQTRGGTT